MTAREIVRTEPDVRPRGWRCSGCGRVYCICSRRPEPDLARRYQTAPEPGDDVAAAVALREALAGVVVHLDPAQATAAGRLLAWSDSWPSQQKAALAALLAAARSAGGAR